MMSTFAPRVTAAYRSNTELSKWKPDWRPNTVSFVMP